MSDEIFMENTIPLRSICREDSVFARCRDVLCECKNHECNETDEELDLLWQARVGHDGPFKACGVLKPYV